MIAMGVLRARLPQPTFKLLVAQHCVLRMCDQPLLTLPYLTLPYHTLHYFTTLYLTLLYDTLPYLTLLDLTIICHTSPYPTLPYVPLLYLTLPYPTHPHDTRMLFWTVIVLLIAQPLICSNLAGSWLHCRGTSHNNTCSLLKVSSLNSVRIGFDAKHMFGQPWYSRMWWSPCGPLGLWRRNNLETILLPCFCCCCCGAPGAPWGAHWGPWGAHGGWILDFEFWILNFK